MVGRVDAIAISSPEYAHGVPGSLKNLLDWLVGSLEFPGKRVALIRSSSRGLHADASLREILRTMNAEVVEAACVTVPVLGKEMDGAAIAGDMEMRNALLGALDALKP
jgi:NAD(P)H-dependent FMN reductase